MPITNIYLLVYCLTANTTRKGCLVLLNVGLLIVLRILIEIQQRKEDFGK